LERIRNADREADRELKLAKNALDYQIALICHSGEAGQPVSCSIPLSFANDYPEHM